MSEIAERVGEDEQSEAESVLPNVWFCQYLPGEDVKEWTSKAKPGSRLTWGAPQLPKLLKAGDAVIYWRTIKDKIDRGGIVGTGHVESREMVQDKDGVDRLPTIVHEFYDDDPIPRDEVIKNAGIVRKSWQGAVLRLPLAQAQKVDELLRARGRKSLFGPEFDPQGESGLEPERESELETTSITEPNAVVHIRRDDAERDHDTLGRGPLAVSFAWRLHRVWCTEQGLRPCSDRDSMPDRPGFVCHVDAPWGGGKTTFANLVARVLNPHHDATGTAPVFLKTLYSERTDLSGLFIDATHQPGGLSENGSYVWDEAARRPWIVIPFDAWLHQHVEPPWWCFYQRIRKGCFRTIRHEGLPTVEQRDDGSYATREDKLAVRYYRWIRLWAQEVLWRLTNGKVVFQLSVLLISVLISLWLLNIGAIETSDGKSQLSTSAGIGVVLSFLTGAGAFIIAVTTVFADALAPGRTILGERLRLGSSDPLARFRRHFRRMLRDIERPVLVIIDDIDRCRPEFIVELVRGLQTILRSSRVVHLILGDRKWVEKAFEVCNKDMNEIDVGPEHTFGGRFVEKVIQLSFVLPGIGEKQKEYVREVLNGKAAEQHERTEVREILRDEKIENLDSIGSALEQASEHKDDPAYRQRVREEVILRRGSRKAEVQQHVEHHLQPLAEHLPSNPRHIKRIINAIAMYQDSLLLTDTSFEDAGVGKKRWCELVIGVVLMMGYSKSWAALSADPSLVDEIGEQNIVPLPDSASERDRTLARLRDNTGLVRLLTQTNFPASPAISSETIRWLNQVMPMSA